MKQALRRVWVVAWERLRASAWTPLVAKGVAGSALLLGLALVGSGAFDRWMAAKPAFGAVERGARARASAARSEGAGASSAASSAAPPAAVSSAAAPAAASSATPGAYTSDGRLILNLATEADLDKLPGIGAAKAKAIVELRSKLGGKLKRLEDLTRIRGIKRKLLTKLRPLVVLDPPVEPAQ